MQYIWGTDIILQYFRTGKFRWQAPVGGKVQFDEGSKPGLDFIGMNYYGRSGSRLAFPCKLAMIVQSSMSDCSFMLVATCVSNHPHASIVQLECLFVMTCSMLAIGFDEHSLKTTHGSYTVQLEDQRALHAG